MWVVRMHPRCLPDRQDVEPALGHRLPLTLPAVLREHVEEKIARRTFIAGDGGNIYKLAGESCEVFSPDHEETTVGVRQNEGLDPSVRLLTRSTSDPDSIFHSLS